jgi:uncharacterized membrane protein
VRRRPPGGVRAQQRQEGRRRRTDLTSRLAIVALVAVLAAVTISSASAGSEEAREGVPARERLARWLEGHGIRRELIVVAIATLPIFELRGSIPVALGLFRMAWWYGFLLSVVGNLIPVVPLLLLLGPVSRRLSRWALGDRFFRWLFARTRRRSDIVRQYQSVGLMLFVAIPLPVTGAWTGCVAAFLFGVDLLQALPAITLGVCIAGTVVTSLMMLGVVGAIIAGGALTALAVTSLIGLFRGKKTRAEP